MPDSSTLHGPEFDPLCLAGVRVLDVSRRLDRCGAYPGDPEYERAVVSGPDEPPLSRLTLCAHSGTHVDAPSHVLPGGPSLESLEMGGRGLGRFVLPALVVAVADEVADEVTGKGGLVARVALEAALGAFTQASGSGWPGGRGTQRAVKKGQFTGRDDPLISAPRDAVFLGGIAVLVRTANSANPRMAAGEFDPAYTALAPDAARLLAGLGAALVGVDGPSVDPFGASDPAAHRILLGAGIPLLENLDLSGVEPGLYGLVCLPLSLDPGAEASPVRAVLLARK